jgi:tetratricopeptide (TPR) repeat protein
MKNRNRLALYDARGTGGRLRPRNAVRSGRPIRAAREDQCARQRRKICTSHPARESHVGQPGQGAAHEGSCRRAQHPRAVHGEVGRDAEAEPRFKRALAITERVLGLESVDIAIELNNLAALCQREQRYAEAEPLLKRALALSERSRPANHPAIARALNNLATNYEKPGRHAESEALTGRALAIREAAVGPDHPDTAASANNLASLYPAEGRAAVPFVARMISRALSIPNGRARSMTGCSPQARSRNKSSTRTDGWFCPPATPLPATSRARKRCGARYWLV